MNVSFSLSHVVVLLAVAGVQIELFRRARHGGAGLPPEQRDEIRQRCLQDLGARASRGLPPDWTYCQNELDRAFESGDDRIRRLASAALAVGLGGTLLAIVSHFFLAAGAAEPARLIASTGISLLGSLLGVAGHLGIVLICLPRAEEVFRREAAALEAELRTWNEIGFADSGLAGTLRSEIAALREAVSQQFSSVFATAVSGFPEVVEGLRQEVGRLAEVTRQQGEGLGPAAATLASCAKSVEKAARSMQPGAEGLIHTATVLAELPTQLGQALDERRDSWLASLREEQKGRLDELMAAYRTANEAVAERERKMLERARELLAAVAEVHQAAGQLPDQFSRQIERLASRLGAEFGKEARQQTADVSAEVQRAFAELGERVARHEQEWRNNLGGVIAEILRGIEDEVRQGLGGELGAAARSLRDVAEQLPAAGRELQSGVEAWNASQERSREGWAATGEAILAASRAIAGAEGPLRGSLAALSSGGERLARQLNEAEGVSAQVAKSLGAAVATHLEQVGQVQKSAEGLLEKARQSQQRAEQVLLRQSDLIRLLLTQRRGESSARASA